MNIYNLKDLLNMKEGDEIQIESFSRAQFIKDQFLITLKVIRTENKS